MLVKILSFIASVLSSARYKAVLIPCIVLVLAATGLTVVAVVHDGGSRTAASTTTQTGNPEKQQSSSPQISGMGAQTPKDSDQNISGNPGTVKPNTESSTGNAASTPTTPVPAAFDFALNKNTLTLNRDSTSDMLIATTSDAADVTWTITPEASDNNFVEIVTEKQKNATAVLNFRLRTTANATPGQYRFTVTAQDSARTINLSKIIALTVAP